MKSMFEQMGGTYSLSEDGMYYPDLALPEEDEPHYGKYGRMRERFLKEHRNWPYFSLILEGKLNRHLNEMDDAANEMLDLMIRQMAERQGITEKLKARDQMAWVGAMNNIRSAAEEIILNELIYR